MLVQPYALPLPRSTPLDGDFGFSPTASSVGAAQRASLGRGIAFVLLLAASSLASIYVPVALHGPGWVEGTAPGPLVARTGGLIDR